MAPHSNTFAWKIPWTEEPGRLQSMGSLGVGYDWATSLSLFTFLHWRRKWQPTPVFLPGESQGRAAWWAAIYGVAQSWTRLKRLSSGSSSSSTAALPCCVRFCCTQSEAAKHVTKYLLFCLFVPFPFRKEHRALSRVPCSIQDTLINYLFYTYIYSGYMSIPVS